MDKTTAIELLVSSTNLKPEDIPKFKIGVKITNNLSHEIHFDLSESELYVNSIKNMAWDLTVQNGTIINLVIPANKSKTVQWPLGEALFRTSGIYELKLIWKSVIQKQLVFIPEV